MSFLKIKEGAANTCMWLVHRIFEQSTRIITKYPKRTNGMLRRMYLLQ